MLVFSFPANLRFQTMKSFFQYAVALCAASLLPVFCAAQTAPVGVPTITLDDAIQRSQSADSAYAAAKANAGVAQAQRTIARSGLLPGIVYHNQYLYTQAASTAVSTAANGSNTSPIRFVGNNTVHEYTSQGIVTETIGGAGIAALQGANADAAAARALLEVARRGLVSTVVGNYYGALAADAKAAIAERALDEANEFGKNTQQRENGGEVAHADVVRADLEIQQRQRELNDARLADEKAHIDLGVLLFPDPTTAYKLAASLEQLPALPPRADIDAAAKANNPDLRAAIETLHSADFDVKAARFGYLPDLSLSLLYGIDAPQFAIHAPDGTSNLGYAGVATLDIPVWDWFATHERVKQSDFRRDKARVDLTVTQRQLLASLEELYREAEVSQIQLGLLDKSVQSAAESLRLSRLRYTAGEGSVLEVVDAQTSVVTAEAGRADGAVRYYVALANLQTLTGSLP
jgi:outer membrane protein